VLFDVPLLNGLRAENGSSMDCSVTAGEKFSTITALEGTEGVLLSANEASDEMNPTKRKKPTNIASNEPSIVAARIFRKFFIKMIVDF
jgi:hypothetical protein